MQFLLKIAKQQPIIVCFAHHNAGSVITDIASSRVRQLFFGVWCNKYIRDAFIYGVYVKMCVCDV